MNLQETKFKRFPKKRITEKIEILDIKDKEVPEEKYKIGRGHE
jgi:hypothetical protein